MQVKKKPKKTAKAVPEKSRKKKQPSEDQIKKQPFLKRMLFGEEKPDLSELEAGSTTILDILSPTTVDTKSRDYIIVDDVYHAYLYITGYGYTTTVGTCWLAPLVEAGEGINLSFLVKRQPKEKILSKIAQTTMVNRSRMRDVGDTRQDYEELDSAISSGLYLKDVMNRQGENFYYMHTLIEVTASDPETLEQRVTEVEKLCVSVDMIARRCDYKNEQAFLSALPILALDPDIERKARRNALTSGVAAAFPFVSYELSDHDGIFLGLNLYTVPADQFFFQKEHKKNHTCPHCGMPLWSAVNPDKRIDWVKIGEYGWVYRYGAQAHLHRTKNERVLDQLAEIAQNPDAFYPIRGAHRRFPLSTYIKKKLRGRIDGFLCDELHEYNNNSGQGDAMAELYGASRCFVGMTATLINGYSSGIFHLLYRIVPGLMLKDGKRYKSPGDFDAEYGVVENTYEIQDAEYNSNRRTSKRRTKSKQLPGVSPLVFSRFLLEYTAFLSLSDMGKDLPDYEEIPVPLEMPEDVRTAYKEAEHELQKVLRTDRKAAQKILSTYLNLLTVYPDQPYDQPEVVHPINGMPIVTPKNCGDFSRLFPKEERVLELVRQKAANGERVLIYTSWTRTDSQKKLQELLCSEGYRTEILTPQIATDKREDWVNKRVKSGLQVLITNPRCVETGLDLNAFTTIIFYSMGYNLFTLRQASRRSWRINQTAPRVEVYMLYYADTMQAKAMKLMASKLAVAGIIEGTFSEEGLAAMSDVKDLTSQMAKELALGIRDNVEDIAAAFRKMAVMNPERKKNIAAAQLKETAAEEQKAPAAKDSFGVRTAQAQVRQALYEGLLARTAEEQKKRKSKKAEVDENQLSIFGFAA